MMALVLYMTLGAGLLIMLTAVLCVAISDGRQFSGINRPLDIGLLDLYFRERRRWVATLNDRQRTTAARSAARAS